MTACASAISVPTTAELCRQGLLGNDKEKGGRSPQPSEGQQSLQLRIQDWLGLLGLTLREQIIE